MIEGLIRRISGVLAAIALASLFLMMLQTVADVLATNIMHSPIAGNLEIISIYHMVFVVFLPLAWVDLKHEHISVDLFYRAMPARLQRIILVAGYITAALFFAILTWRTGYDAWKSFQINEVTMAAIYVTIWPAKFALPVGFAAIFATSLLHAAKAVLDPDFDPVPDSPEDAGV